MNIILWSLVIAQIIGNVQCAPVEHVYSLHVCKGLSPDECADVIPCVKKVTIKMAEIHNETLTEDDIPDTVSIGDIVVTPEQCEVLLRNIEDEAKAELEEETGSTRKKRKALNFRRIPYRKWSLPVYYTIDKSSYSLSQEQQIHKAFKHWEERTCLKFEVVDSHSRLPHIEVASLDGCFSSLGKTGNPKQYMSLRKSGCLYYLGVGIHEIAHALGLIHEHSRPDRSSYVRIFYSKIQSRYHSQFYRSSSTITHGLPYDYASVMHYAPADFSKVRGDRVLEAKQEEFMYTYGQRVEASFMDVLIVNLMYGCLDPNSPNVPDGCVKPTVTCQHGGYPDPGDDCQSCRCPDGLSGDCTTAAPGSEGCTPVSGTINVMSTQETCLQSPGYGERAYLSGEQCSWILQAPEQRTIQLYFDTSKGFGVFPQSDVCFHWVEIKSNGNFTETGPRFCGSAYKTLNEEETILSKGNQVVVSFRSLHDTGDVFYHYQRGFKLCYHLTGSDAVQKITTTTPTTTTPKATTPITTTLTTTTPTTTTPTTTTPTTTTPTTTTPITTTLTTTTPTTTTPTTTTPEATTPITTTLTTTTPTTTTPTITIPETTTHTTTTPEATTPKITTLKSTTPKTTTITTIPTTTETPVTTTTQLLYCMNCTAKHNAFCTSSRFTISFTQACPIGSPGCYSSVAIKGTGHPYRTLKGCMNVGESCSREGYLTNSRTFKKYCCWSDKCNEKGNYP